MSSETSLAGPRPQLRVFISSPGDVNEERLIAKRILDRLVAEFAAAAKIEPIFWEHEPLLASATFQGQIVRPSETDIVVCILWSRLGTRLPPQFTRPDGSRYDSGTQFEFEDALQGQRQKGVPDLLVYRKTAEPLVSLKDIQAADRAFGQYKLLDEFVRHFFHGDDGTLVAAFHPFDSAADFEARLESHLRKLIERRLQALGVSLGEQPAAIQPSWKDCPFRGLDVFEFEHQEIFFGRTQATSDVIGQLRRQAEAGRAFLLVLGASGCGKSSLLRAGVLPLLVQPGVIEGVGLWRRAIMRPSDRLTLESSSRKPADLFDALVSALLSADAVPELVADGTTSDKLAADLRANPAIVAALIKGALSQAASHLPRAEGSPVQPSARLVVVLDQLEELFGPQGAPPAEQQSFFRAIASLSSSGHTWILATLRSDFFHRCADIPELSALMAAGGQHALQPPDATEIGQLIRRPATAAGLRFQEDPQHGARLDDLLRDAAVKDRDSLPLLEFTLEELFHQRQGSLLTLAAYRQLGGIEGAIGRRADEVFSKLPADAQAALPHVFRQLVAIGGDDGETVTRRPAPIEQFDGSHPTTAPGSTTAQPTALPPTPARTFVDAFVAARLFTAKEKAGVPVVEVSHEALLIRWKQVVDWLETDKKLLRHRAGVERAAAKWLASGRKSDLLLPAGTPLEEGLELLAAGFPISPVERELIAQSQDSARRRVRVRRTALATLVLLTALAVGGAWLAMIERKRAQEQRDAAEQARVAETQAKGDALRARDESQKAAARAEQSEQRAVKSRNEAETSAKLAEEQRDLAIQSLNMLVSDVQDKLAGRPGLQDLKRQMLQAALEGLQRISKSFQTSSGASDHSAATAQMKIGDILLELGATKDAAGLFRSALAIFERLAQAEPQNNEAQRDLSISYGKLGDMGVRQGDLAAARKFHEQGMEIAQRLAQADPKNSRAQRDLSVSHSKLGDVSVLEGDLSAARKFYEQGLEIAQRLAQADPQNAQAQRDLSISYKKLVLCQTKILG